MSRIADYLSPEEAAREIIRTAAELNTDELVAVHNLGFVPHQSELYFLVPKSPLPLAGITAFAVDMDGTSTTTEPLALHSLEFMVRRLTGKRTRAEWAGLDSVRDIPFVIGNSNFRHTEFLMKQYAADIDPGCFRDSFFEAMLWTLSAMDDRQRRDDVKTNAINCGLEPVLHDSDFLNAIQTAPQDDELCAELVKPFIQRFGSLFHPRHFTAQVSAAMDIYYHRYHAILRRMERGDSKEIAFQLLGDENQRLVAPMPGYGIFLCLVKGWLGEDAVSLAPLLRAAHVKDPKPREGDTTIFRALLSYFKRNPARTSLVTASIAYEAHVVMKEVVQVIRDEVSTWPIPPSLQAALREKLADYRAVYDGFVTASDSWEARLKPHRDLYSIALHEMSVPKPAYPQCVAIEDTEPGILSARAAGFGVTVALPNHDTNLQNYEKASIELHGGLPELILDRHLLLDIQPK